MKFKNGLTAGSADGLVRIEREARKYLIRRLTEGN